MTRLSDDAVMALRERAAAGEAIPRLAEEYGISRGYGYKVAMGEARAGVLSPSEGESGDSLAATVAAFVAGLGELPGRRAALAGLAVDLARRLDGLPPGSAAGAAAAARVAAQLADLLADLASTGDHEDASAAAARMLRGLMRGG